MNEWGGRVLVAGHRHVTVGVDIRNANADMIESLVAQRTHGRPIGMVKVDIDAVVAALMLEKVESITQVIHQALEMSDGGCSAAQVKLFDPLLRSQMTTDEVDLLFQALKVLFDFAVLAGDIARGTKGWLEAGRQLHVQGDRAAFLPADAQGAKQIQRADAVMKLLCVGMAVGVEYALIAPSDQIAGGVRKKSSMTGLRDWLRINSVRDWRSMLLDLYQAQAKCLQDRPWGKAAHHVR